MFTIALVMVPPDFKIDYFISPGESMGYFKESDKSVDHDEILKLHMMVLSTPVSATAGMVKSHQKRVHEAYLNVLKELDLVHTIKRMAENEYEQDYGERERVFDNYLIINLFNFINDLGWVEKVTKAIVEHEDYVDEMKGLLDKFT